MSGNIPFVRSEWPKLLSVLPATQLKAVADELESKYAVTDLLPGQAGLALLQLRDSALGDNYFMGEIPLSQAHVRLTTQDGRSVEGAAQVMDDRAGVARAISIIDAVLSERLPGYECVVDLLNEGMGIVEASTRQRRALLNATKVDFSILGSSEELDNND